jgi:hypothetical protein
VAAAGQRHRGGHHEQDAFGLAVHRLIMRLARRVVSQPPFSGKPRSTSCRPDGLHY